MYLPETQIIEVSYTRKVSETLHSWKERLLGTMRLAYNDKKNTVSAKKTIRNSEPAHKTNRNRVMIEKALKTN